jgi:crotonobetaine/carnitine-CoA ligase
MYTSGTTGTPKGVLWSRHCEATWASAYVGLLGIDEGEGAYCCLPLFHVTCQGTVLGTLLRGGRLTVDARFSAFRFWSRIREADAAVFTFVGTILSVLAKRAPRPDDADNPVRRILGAAAPVDLWREIERRFDVEIVETWGQTETASCWTSPAQLPQRPGTVGRANERWEARIVDDEGEEVGPGAVGELWMRPRQAHVMFEGYVGPEGVTDEAWTPDGWYRTGDLLVRDHDGDFAFRGRLREAIRRRGEMIAAGEIEAAALSHPEVLEAAAVGVPADDWGEEEVKLCVVLGPDGGISPPELVAFLAERLPRFMVPRYVDVRAEMPKTPSTRVQKYRLSAEGAAGAWDARARPDTSTDVEPR